MRAIIEAARDLSKPIVVDPKEKDFSIYRGAYAKLAEYGADDAGGAHERR